MSEREVDQLQKIRQQQAEIERLMAIVDKLPKTADGVPVVPGMTLYKPHNLKCGHVGIKVYANSHTVENADADGRHNVRRFGHADGWLVKGEECYSTREAAEAAKEKT